MPHVGSRDTSFAPVASRHICHLKYSVRPCSHRYESTYGFMTSNTLLGHVHIDTSPRTGL